MTWLVTGGAGYIGAHVVRSLVTAGLGAVVVDDLSTGRASTVPEDVPLVVGSVLDTDLLRGLIREHRIDGVVHLAAKKAPSESVENPIWYYQENVGGMSSVLDAMRESTATRIVLSSSCSVYGNPDDDQVREDAPFRPESPYGQTKVASEWLVGAAGHAYGFGYANLRYFNVAGTGARELADQGAMNLIPMVFRALEAGQAPTVFGTDYPTPDGSCVRDYVHVQDLADAHATAALRLMQAPIRTAFNVGRGHGSSVLEVLAAIRAITGIDMDPQPAARRPGDPVHVVGDVTKIEKELGWTARHDLDSMVRSAWEARQPVNV